MRRSCGLSALLALFVPAIVAAQEEASINWAFATQLGSGIYLVNGRQVQIYRVNGNLRLVDRPDDGGGLRLRIPGTIGFLDFKIEDAIDHGLPESAASITVVPSLELEIPRRENWWLVPFVDAGVGRDFSEDRTLLIFGGGLRSISFFGRSPRSVSLGNRLVYSLATDGRFDFQDDFAAFENGFDVRRPAGLSLAGRELDVSLFAVSYLYLVSPRLVRPEFERLEMRTEWELGTTVGTAGRLEVLGFGLPRLGVSYRFGSGVDAIRLVIGNPFVLNSPRDAGREIQ